MVIDFPQGEEQAVAFGEARLEEDFTRGSREFLDEYTAFPYPEGEKANFLRESAPFGGLHLGNARGNALV